MTLNTSHETLAIVIASHSHSVAASTTGHEASHTNVPLFLNFRNPNFSESVFNLELMTIASIVILI